MRSSAHVPFLFLACFFLAGPLSAPPVSSPLLPSFCGVGQQGTLGLQSLNGQSYTGSPSTSLGKKQLFCPASSVLHKLCAYTHTVSVSSLFVSYFHLHLGGSRAARLRRTILGSDIWGQFRKSPIFFLAKIRFAVVVALLFKGGFFFDIFSVSAAGNVPSQDQVCQFLWEHVFFLEGGGSGC